MEYFITCSLYKKNDKNIISRLSNPTIFATTPIWELGRREDIKEERDSINHRGPLLLTPSNARQT
jgi:hypothetical protein